MAASYISVPRDLTKVKSLENVLWALFLYSTEGALLKCGPKHLISGLLPFFGHREGEENEQYYISRKYFRTEN